MEHKPGRGTSVKYIPVLNANNYKHMHVSIQFLSTATLKCIFKSALLGPSAILSPLPADLKKQFFTVDVINQESVVLIHHSQFIAGGTHVQAAH